MSRWEVFYEKYKRSRVGYVKDLVLILFGFSALHFVLTVFSVNVPSQLLGRSKFPWLIVFFSLSEYIFFAHFKRFVGYLLEITRTAIGRWTPYLFLFGILSSVSFPLTAVSVVSELTLRKVLYLILFNFSIFGYTMSLVGLASDKLNFNDPKLKLLFPFSAFLGTFTGLLTSTFGSGSSRDVIVTGAILLLTSAITVAFFVVEDKRFKVKMSTSERLEVYQRYFGIERKFPSLKFSISKADARFSLAFSFFLLQEIYTFYVWDSKDLPSNLAYTTVTVSLLAFTAVHYLPERWRLTFKGRTIYLPAVVSVLMILSHVSLSEKVLVSLFLTIVLSSGLLGLYCRRSELYFLPTRAERIAFYLTRVVAEEQEKVASRSLSVFLTTFGASILLSVLSSSYLYLILSVLSLSLLILDLSKKVV